MKKILMFLLIGMMLCPVTMDAKKYKTKHGSENPDLLIMAPARYRINVYVDEEAGDVAICPNYNIVGLTVTIAQGSTVYEQATVSLAAGQVYATTLADYDEGDYTLTLTNSDGDVVTQYIITVEDD